MIVGKTVQNQELQVMEETKVECVPFAISKTEKDLMIEWYCVENAVIKVSNK